MYGSFGVSAYSYTGSWSESRTPDYFYNATASKSGSGDYALASTYYWPGASYKMKFFRLCPERQRAVRTLRQHAPRFSHHRRHYSKRCQ